MEYLLPDKLFRVRGGPGIAATAADECLAIFMRVPWNLARRVLAEEDLEGCDLCFAVDRGQRIDVPRGSQVQLILG